MKSTIFWMEAPPHPYTQEILGQYNLYEES